MRTYEERRRQVLELRGELAAANGRYKFDFLTAVRDLILAIRDEDPFRDHSFDVALILGWGWATKEGSKEAPMSQVDLDIVYNKLREAFAGRGRR